MEKLVKRYATLLKAYQALDYSIRKEASLLPSTPEEDVAIVRDSVIQRFEFSYDLTWKYLKEYINQVHGIELVSPKTVFQECLNVKITDNNETRELLKMIVDRNLTTHVYDEVMAESIGNHIIHHYRLMQKLAERTNPANIKK